MRVLIVEDEVDLADAVADGLKSEGFDAEVANDGTEGLWRARERPYDAIILDVLLPGMDGLSVCRELRQAGIWTPILVLTVRGGEFNEADALNLGADQFLAKPFSFLVLVARLRAMLRRDVNPRVPPLVAGALKMDLQSQAVSCAGQPVDLTPREFALLHALMRAGGAVVTRAELLDRVWGWDFAGNPGVLDVYVGYLRDKLDRPYGRESVQTVRGLGYRLVAGEPG